MKESSKAPVEIIVDCGSCSYEIKNETCLDPAKPTSKSPCVEFKIEPGRTIKFTAVEGPEDSYVVAIVGAPLNAPTGSSRGTCKRCKSAVVFSKGMSATIKTTSESSDYVFPITLICMERDEKGFYSAKDCPEQTILAMMAMTGPRMKVKA